MAGRTIILLLLAAFVTLATAQGSLSRCCRGVSRPKLSQSKLESYYNQTGHPCALEAVVFTTKAGKKICSDPKSEWTKVSIDYLDKKKKQSRSHPRLKNYKD